MRPAMTDTAPEKAADAKLEEMRERARAARTLLNKDTSHD